jgi:hypothetical protein
MSLKFQSFHENDGGVEENFRRERQAGEIWKCLDVVAQNTASEISHMIL